MAMDNVTPIYGEWLVNHISYYDFIGENAEALKRDLLSIDISSLESDEKLIECYRKFTSMFVYDVYDTAFEEYSKGIIAKNNKGFLVCNQYNVWAPIGFMEDNGKRTGLDLDYTNSITNRKMNEKANELKIIWDEYKISIDELDRVEKKSKPSLIRALVTMTICTCVVVLYALHPKAPSDVDFKFPMVLVWGSAALIALVGAVKAISEIRAMCWWKKIESIVLWFRNLIAQAGGDNSELEGFKQQLAVLEQEGSLYNLPKPSRSLRQCLQFMDGKAKTLQTALNSPGKLRRKTGLVTMLLLGVVLVFVAYGQNHWAVLDVMRNIGEEVVLDDTEQTADKDAQPQKILTGLNPVGIANATATSELTTKTRTYSIALSYDGDMSTCWQDGVEGDGTGEVLVYYFDQPRYIVAMDVTNGRVVSEDKYFDNNRIASMTLYYFSNGEVTASVEIHFDDVYSTEPVQYQLAEKTMDKKYQCEGIQIVIESIYAGNKYNDLCLTDICFYEGVYK